MRRSYSIAEWEVSLGSWEENLYTGKSLSRKSKWRRIIEEWSWDEGLHKISRLYTITDVIEEFWSNNTSSMMKIMCENTLATKTSMKGFNLFHIETNQRLANLHRFNHSFLKNLAQHSRQSNVDTNLNPFRAMTSLLHLITFGIRYSLKISLILPHSSIRRE